MKKFILLSLCAFMISTSVFAWEQIPLTAKDVNEEPIGHNMPRGPIKSPTLYIDDHTLSFETNHPDYVLNIKDAEGVVVHTSSIYTTTTLVTLPLTLSGDFEIELISSDWIFIGHISL